MGAPAIRGPRTRFVWTGTQFGVEELDLGRCNLNPWKGNSTCGRDSSIRGRGTGFLGGRAQSEEEELDLCEDKRDPSRDL
uniref:Uncharacterized protein n=1 Tax=Arundo donax TaxID=35708 RepID=A0A0A9F1W2_ARUDO